MKPSGGYAVMAQKHDRIDFLEDYPTPPWAVRALVEHVICVGRGRQFDMRRENVWEPAANRGYMVRPLREYFAIVHGSDVHDYGAGFEVADFLMHGTGGPGEYDWIITNPPFRLAAQFAEKCLRLRPRKGFALLTRATFLEGQQRYEELFKPHPPTIVAPFVERVPMVKGRHDPKASTATAYTWIVWGPRWEDGETRLQLIPPCRRQLQKPSDA